MSKKVVNTYFPNRRSGKCFMCGVDVARGAAFTVKYEGGGYGTLCMSSVCVEKAGAKVKAEPIAYNEDGDKVVISLSMADPNFAAQKRAIKSLKGARYSQGSWLVPFVDDFDRTTIFESLSGMGLEFPQGFIDESELVDTTEQDEAWLKVCEDRGAFPYQLEGIRFAQRNSHVMIADDMGLGKTMTAIMALRPDERTLVVAPASLLYNWRNEVKKWRPELHAEVLKEPRRPKPGEVLILSYERLPDCSKTRIHETMKGKSAAKRRERVKLFRNKDFVEAVTSPEALDFLSAHKENEAARHRGIVAVERSMRAGLVEIVERPGLPETVRFEEELVDEDDMTLFATDAFDILIDLCDEVLVRSWVSAKLQGGKHKRPVVTMETTSDEQAEEVKSARWEAFVSMERAIREGRVEEGLDSHFVITDKEPEWTGQEGYGALIDTCGQKPTDEWIVAKLKGFKQSRPKLVSDYIQVGGYTIRPKDIEVAIDIQGLDERIDEMFEGIALVGDEVHLAKNYAAGRSINLKRISLAADRVIALTGTPLANKPQDLFGTLESLDLARRSFGSWKNFKHHFGAYKTQFGIRFGEPSVHVPGILSKVMIRRKRVDVLPDLPRKSYRLIEIPLDPSDEADLDKMWDDWEDVFDGMDERSALPPFEMFSEMRALLAAKRIPAMLEIVGQYEEAGEPLVVFSAHREPIDVLDLRPGWGVITGEKTPEERQLVVDDFQAGLLKGIALTIAAGGVGLTLTRAHHELFVDLAWRPCDNAQAEDRCCRIGQTADSVLVTRLVSNHVLEHRVYELLDQKQRLIEAALDSEIIAMPESARQELKELGLVEETEETWKARKDAFEAAQEEARRKAELEREQELLEKAERVRQRHNEWVERTAHRQKERSGLAQAPVFDAHLVEVMKKAYGYMLSVCDGAVERDDAGFNKPDALVSRKLLEYDLDTERAQVALYFLLRRYHRQLSGDYPEIFDNAYKARSKKAKQREHRYITRTLGMLAGRIEDFVSLQENIEESLAGIKSAGDRKQALEDDLMHCEHVLAVLREAGLRLKETPKAKKES